ncbi:MAG: Fic family protein [Deltaproteobacteria bacterium]|jgi:death-on-curing family protein|nr:Fic family protein [Deltaproteobacteria bacterium]
MELLSKDKIIEINSKIEPNSNIINGNLITSYEASLPYCSTISLKLSAIARSLIKNHCFSDGNKRTAFIVLKILCKMNNITLNNTNLGDKILYIAKNNYEIDYISNNILFFT